MAVRRWTAEEDARLRELYQDPARSAWDIADELGRTRAAVLNRAVILDIKKKSRVYTHRGTPTSQRARYGDREILEAIRRAYARYGHSLTMREWRARGLRPTPIVVYLHFGSWLGGWREAGIEPAGHSRRNIVATVGEETIRMRFRAFAVSLGHNPSRTEWDAWDERPVISDSLIKGLGVTSWVEVVKRLGNPALPKRPLSPVGKKIARVLGDEALPEALTLRERKVAQGLLAGRTLREIGAEVGVTGESVRLIGRKVFQRIRAQKALRTRRAHREALQIVEV